MRKRSKLLLLCGGIIIVLGLIVCVVGAIMANTSGDQLFATKTDKGYVYTYSFSGDEINKVSLDVTDASVNIIGGAEKSCIELCNFDENYYSFTMTNRIIQFKESGDLKGLLSFWENGFTFKGMRYIFKLGGGSGEKEVNIYLADGDYVKNFTVEVDKGEINISDLSTLTDYNMTTGGGSVIMNNVETESVVTVNAPEASTLDIKLTDVSCSALNVNAAKARLVSDRLSFGSGAVDITNGSAQIDFLPQFDYFKVSVKASGKLTVNETGYIDSFEFEKVPEVSGDGEGTSENKPDDLPALTVNGRDLSVKLTGECFDDMAEDGETE